MAVILATRGSIFFRGKLGVTGTLVKWNFAARRIDELRRECSGSLPLRHSPRGGIQRACIYHQLARTEPRDYKK